MAFGGDGDDARAADERGVLRLAVLAALNPKLFAVDLQLIENAGARLMDLQDREGHYARDRRHEGSCQGRGSDLPRRPPGVPWHSGEWRS
jgi:hypothetical protein